MSGISSKTASTLENKKKYNGIEQENSFDINIGETFFRTHDPQLGRWWQIDPKIENGQESISAYCAMGNNPISIIDPIGDLVEGYDEKSAKETKGIMQRSFNDNKKLQKLFQLGKDGKTFKHISDKKFNRAIKNEKNKDVVTLAKAYKEAINDDKNTHTVKTVSSGEEFDDKIKSYSNNRFTNASQITGGGINLPTGGKSDISIILTDGSADPGTDYKNKVEKNGETYTVRVPSSGELLAHEMLGHGVALIPNYRISSTTTNAIQMTNLYLRATRISDFYRDGYMHGGFNISLSEEIANGLPKYLRQ